MGWLIRQYDVPATGARETVRFLPPLNISADEVEEGLGLFEGALADVFGGSHHVADDHHKRAGS